MFRKHIPFLASIICLAVLTSCLQSGNETPVTSGYGDETTATSTDFNESDKTSDTSTSDNLISDEEAIALFLKGRHTVYSWFGFGIYTDMTSKEVIYRDFGLSKNEAYYPLAKDSYQKLDEPDIAGNTGIYYGDYNWMEKHLKGVFSERFIKEYYSYEYPLPLIYENGTMYLANPYDMSNPPKDLANYTIIHKTENEFALICEVFDYDWYVYDYDYSEIEELEYMKLIKSGDTWLIDEYNSSLNLGAVRLNDPIPSEYKDNVPEKYYEMTIYFEN